MAVAVRGIPINPSNALSDLVARFMPPFGRIFTNPIATPVAKRRYVLELQPDETTGVDTYLQYSASDVSFATSANMLIRSTNRLGLLMFTGLSVIPAVATIISAVIDVANVNAMGETTTAAFHRILAANSGLIEGATWNYANPTSIRWAGDVGANGGADAGCSVSGTDYYATAMGTVTFNSGDPSVTHHTANLDLTEFGLMLANNYGWVVITPSTAGWALRTSSAAEPGRPKITVTYDA